jgi:hypothetical protein
VTQILPTSTKSVSQRRAPAFCLQSGEDETWSDLPEICGILLFRLLKTAHRDSLISILEAGGGKLTTSALLGDERVRWEWGPSKLTAYEEVIRDILESGMLGYRPSI